MLATVLAAASAASTLAAFLAAFGSTPLTSSNWASAAALRASAKPSIGHGPNVNLAGRPL